jgi:hypothetical protein
MDNSTLVLVLVWAISVFYCLIKLRNLRLDPVASALWTLVILILPYLGALGFLLVRPTAAGRAQNG